MAPLVVIRSGSKYVEYHESRAEWMRRQHNNLHSSAHGNSSSSSSTTVNINNQSDLEAAFAFRDGIERVDDSDNDEGIVRGHSHRLHNRFRFFGDRERRGRSSGDHSRQATANTNGNSSSHGRHAVEDTESSTGIFAWQAPPTSCVVPATVNLSTDLFAAAAHGGGGGFHCAECGNLVAAHDDIVAKSFFGRTGKAFLMNNMFNVANGSPRNRYLMTGMHTIADVTCTVCTSVLGWKYLKAMEASQQYKEGKYIVEKALVQDAAEELAWCHH